MSRDHIATTAAPPGRARRIQGRVAQVRDLPDARVADTRRGPGLPLRAAGGRRPPARFTGNARAFHGELEERPSRTSGGCSTSPSPGPSSHSATSAWWYQGSEKTPKRPGAVLKPKPPTIRAVDVRIRADQGPAPHRAAQGAGELAASRPPAHRRRRPALPRGSRRRGRAGARRPGTLAVPGAPGQADAFRAAAEAGRHLLDAAQVDPTPARSRLPGSCRSARCSTTPAAPGTSTGRWSAPCRPRPSPRPGSARSSTACWSSVPATSPT